MSMQAWSWPLAAFAVVAFAIAGCKSETESTGSDADTANAVTETQDSGNAQVDVDTTTNDASGKDPGNEGMAKADRQNGESSKGNGGGSKTTTQVNGGTDKVAVDKTLHPFSPTEDWIRLDEKQDIWIDKANKRIVIDGEVCLREGVLELFACEEGMKTHESVIMFKGKPSTVHAGLLAIGAEQGDPVSFEPKYYPAAGAEIRIHVGYLGEDENLKVVTAQDMVRNKKTDKPLEHPFVFGGSYFWTHPMTGEQIYMGDSTGDFICVSNFPTAVMDLPIESSQQNEYLMYEAFTENIPPTGTKVRMALYPGKFTGERRPTKPASEEGKEADAPPEAAPAEDAVKEIDGTDELIVDPAEIPGPPPKEQGAEGEAATEE